MRYAFSNPLLVAVLLIPLLIWTYAQVIAAMVTTWWEIPDYSHGFLVVPAAVYLAWNRRESTPRHARPSVYGIAIVLISITIAWIARTPSAPQFIHPLDRYSILIAIAGLIWLAGGRKLFLWAAPFVAFLAFAIPLPNTVATALAEPLQYIAARSAVYIVQAAGVPAVCDGTLIHIENATLEVAFACSGLQMVISFGAVCTAIAMLSSYDWPGKIVIALSAIPIAIFTNSVRIAIIVWAHRHELAPPRQLHDAGGILVVPLTVALVFLGIFLFEKCFPKQTHRGHTA